MSDELLKRFFPEADSPYVGLALEQHPDDMQGWASSDPVFEEIISKSKPKLLVEVGTWKGASAVHIAKLMKQYCDASARLICIDTWLGSPEHFFNPNDPDRRPSLRMKNGYPQLYYTFLCNMVRQGVDDVVIPLPQPSINGANILKGLGLRPDFIYIDAAHEYGPALEDFRAFWPLLSDSGILVGDDFLSHSDVTKAAYEFSREVKIPLVGKYSKFVLSKNKSLQPKIVLE